MILMEPPVTSDLIRRLEEKIYTGTGGSGNPELSGKIAKPLESAIRIVEKKVKPKAIGRILPVLSSKKDMVVTDVGPIQSPMFASLVNRCDKDRRIVFMLATIGRELEIAAESRHDIFDQWVFDRVGAELVEMVADDVEQHLKEIVLQNRMQFSRRISPGYCDWPLDGQQVVFKALDADQIDVTLSSYMVMMPRKSISCVIAAAETVGLKNPCSLCPKKQCQWRRTDNE